MKGVLPFFLVFILVDWNHAYFVGKERGILYSGKYYPRPARGLYSMNQLENGKGEELDMLFKEGRNPFKRRRRFRKRRTVLNGESLKWLNAIVPYRFAETNSVSLSLRETVLQAMQRVEDTTCVKFVEQSTQRDYVSIDAKDNACYSYVGRIGGSQRLNLGTGCNTVGVALHELMHALSYVHEHNRPDRDDNVIVKSENIFKGAERSFEKYESIQVDTFQTKYDRQSVMHYSNFAFTNKDPQLGESAMTLISRGPQGANEVLGNEEDLSSLDIKRINIRYCQGVVNPPTETPKETEQPPKPTEQPPQTTGQPPQPTEQPSQPTEQPPQPTERPETPETPATETPQITESPVTDNPMVTEDPMTEIPEITAEPTKITPPLTDGPTKQPKGKRGGRKRGKWWKRLRRLWRWKYGRGRGKASRRVTGRRHVLKKVINHVFGK